MVTAQPRQSALEMVVRALSLALIVTGSATARPVGAEELFVDVAAETGLDFVHVNGATGRLYFVEMMGGGAALLDYDGDGDLDVYFSQGDALTVEAPAEAPSVSDRLFRNDVALDAAGGTVVRWRDVTAMAGIPSGGYGMGVATGDVDNDGDPDVYLTNFGSNRLLINQGDGRFADGTEASGTDDPRWSVAASFLDYDGDGRLDLYVGNYVEYRLATHRDCYSDSGVLDYCGPAGFPPEPDRLFRNLGDGRFEDVTRRSGLAATAGAGLGAVAADLTGDGLTDLYVANDGDRNNLWVNQGDGTFRDEALLAGAAVNSAGHPEASMGVVAGDLDQDGYVDLFMSHLTNETNTLYRGSAAGVFDDVSGDSGLGMPSWTSTGFGVALFDYDHDTDLDLFIANGAVKRIEEQLREGAPYPLAQRNQLFANRGDGRFEEITAEAGRALAASEVSRGVASGDVDHDGDVDLLVVNSAGPARLLRNEAGRATSWLGVSVHPAAGRATPIGSRVVLALEDGRRLTGRVATDGSYASAKDPRVGFGLGDESAASIEVAPPTGRAWRLIRPPENRLLVVPASTGSLPPVEVSRREDR